MNWLDLLIVASIAWSAFRGFSTGLIRQVVWFLALVVGVLAAGLLYDDLSANLDFVISDSTTRNLVAFAAIVLGAVLAGAVIGQVLKATASLLLLGPLDSFGGAALGFVRGVVTVQVALILFAVFPAQEAVSSAIAESTLAPYFLDNLPAPGLPGEFSNPLEQLDRWREQFGALIPDGLVPEGMPATHD